MSSGFQKTNEMMELVSRGSVWKSCPMGHLRLILKEQYMGSLDVEGEQNTLPKRGLQPLCPGQTSPPRAEGTQGNSKLWALPDRVPPGGDKGLERADVGGTETPQVSQHVGLGPARRW